MTSEWLSIQSFVQTQDLLDAINTLSLHLKLKLLGIGDEEDRERVQEARQKLAEFLETLEKVIKQVENVETEPLTGLDPRSRQLIRNFAAARKNRKQFKSTLFKKSPAAILKLLDSDKERDEKALLKSLSDLRILLEEHITIDTMRIIGDI